MPSLQRPPLPDGPQRELRDELHELHRRAGWPSVRSISRRLGGGVASPSRVHDAFTKPRLPDWGLVQLIVEELSKNTPDTQSTAEVTRFHRLWLAATTQVERNESGSVREGDAPPEQPAAGPASPSPPEPLSSRDERSMVRAGLLPTEPLLIIAEMANLDSLPDHEREDVARSMRQIASFVRFHFEQPFSDIQEVSMKMFIQKQNSEIQEVADFIDNLILDADTFRPGLRVAVARGSIASGSGYGLTGETVDRCNRMLDSPELQSLTQAKPHWRVSLALTDEVFIPSVRNYHYGRSRTQFSRIGPSRAHLGQFWIAAF